MGGFYFVHVMKLCNEAFSLNCTILGVTLFHPPHLAEQGGEETRVTPRIVPFSVSVLAVVTHKVETPHACLSLSLSLYINIYIYIYIHREREIIDVIVWCMYVCSCLRLSLHVVLLHRSLAQTTFVLLVGCVPYVVISFR